MSRVAPFVLDIFELMNDSGDVASLFKTEFADVFTDAYQSPPLAVEEAIGSFETIVVVWQKSDDTLDIAAGPVYSYYEFVVPYENRLTDEKWREMLKADPPARPEWLKDFRAAPCAEDKQE